MEIKKNSELDKKKNVSNNDQQLKQLKEKIAAFEKEKETFDSTEASLRDKIHVLVEKNKQWQEKTSKLYKEVRQN